MTTDGQISRQKNSSQEAMPIHSTQPRLDQNQPQMQSNASFTEALELRKIARQALPSAHSI